MKKKILGIFLALFLSVTLIACGPSSADKQDVQDALELAGAFSGNPAGEGISRDQQFATTLRDYPDVEITWSSDNPSVLSNEGKVTRPAAGEDDVMVTVTITAKKGKAEDTKEVKFKVLAFVAADTVTLSNLYDDKTELGENKFNYKYMDEYVEMKELTVVGIYTNTNGFYLTDGERLLFIYNPTLGKTVSLNEVYNVKGTFGHNYGTAQLSDDAELELVADATPSVVPLIDGTPKTVHSSASYSADFLFEPVGYNLTGRVLVDEGDLETNYQTYIVEEDYTDYKIVKQVAGGKAVSFEAPTVLIYYQGLLEPIRELDGQKITIPYFPAGSRSDRGGLNYGVFLDIDALTIHETSEEQKAINISNTIKKEFMNKRFQSTVTQLDFFSTIEGYEDLEIEWVSKTPSLVSNTGAVTMPTVDEADVSVIVTVKYGTNEPVVIELTFQVLGELTVGTIADARAAALDTSVTVEGYLAFYASANWAMYDGTGGIVVRGSALEGLDLSKSYVVVGTTGVHNGLKQINASAVVESKVAKDVTNTDIATVTDKDLIDSHLLDGKVTVVKGSYSGNFNNPTADVKVGDVEYTFTADNRFESDFDAAQYAILESGIADGDTLILKNVTYVQGLLRFTSTTTIEVVKS